MTITVLILLIIAIVLLVMYLQLKKQIGNLQAETEAQAKRQYQQWRDSDFERLCVEQLGVARREMNAEMEVWKIHYEATIRADAIMRSQAVITGKVTENLIPYMPIFPYNPKDARFVGSPIDLIVFDGAAEGQLREVVFLEIKTGNATLNQIQRQIRDAVTDGRVCWRELRTTK